MKKYLSYLFIIAMVGEEDKTTKMTNSNIVNKNNISPNAKYVGVLKCTCHQQKEMGKQYEVWTKSTHSRTWVLLHLAIADTIAIKMGVKTHPEESEECLSCHSGKKMIDINKVEDTFKFEDGVQCETCHGPGSEHIKNKSGIDKNALCGFKMLVKDDCLNCHKEKESHSILHKDKFDYYQAIKKIAHPIPKK